MKKVTFVLGLILLAVIAAAVMVLLNYGFDRTEILKHMFSGVSGSGEMLGKVAPDDPVSLANRDLWMAKISMFLFAGVSMLQFVALYIALHVFGGLRKSPEPVGVRLRLLDNADIFLDVPLYIGLFGTVSSFLVMTYSPTSSRLIAYSSTLIGIIFSLILRLALNYPLKKKWIAEQDGAEK